MKRVILAIGLVVGLVGCGQSGYFDSAGRWVDETNLNIDTAVNQKRNGATQNQYRNHPQYPAFDLEIQGICNKRHPTDTAKFDSCVLRLDTANEFNKFVQDTNRF